MICELLFQHRKYGYDKGFTIDLLSKEAKNIISYLKNQSHWYSKEDPYDGVELMPIQCNYIEDNILKRKILDYTKYEIILGFYEFEANSINEAFVAYSNLNMNYFFTSFITPKLSKESVVINTERGRCLAKATKMSIQKVNNEMKCKPIYFLEADYCIKIESIKTSEYFIDESYQLGI